MNQCYFTRCFSGKRGWMRLEEWQHSGWDLAWCIWCFVCWTRREMILWRRLPGAQCTTQCIIRSTLWKSQLCPPHPRDQPHMKLPWHIRRSNEPAMLGFQHQDPKQPLAQQMLHFRRLKQYQVFSFKCLGVVQGLTFGISFHLEVKTYWNTAGSCPFLLKRLWWGTAGKHLPESKSSRKGNTK